MRNRLDFLVSQPKLEIMGSPSFGKFAGKAKCASGKKGRMGKAFYLANFDDMLSQETTLATETALAVLSPKRFVTKM